MADKNPHKIRVRLKDGSIVVKMLLNHPMETGSRKHPATGEPIPRHFIREITCERNGSQILQLDWGWGVSANPYLSFRVRDGKKGDLIRAHWVDNLGETGSVEAEVT